MTLNFRHSDHLRTLVALFCLWASAGAHFSGFRRTSEPGTPPPSVARTLLKRLPAVNRVSPPLGYDKGPPGLAGVHWNGCRRYFRSGPYRFFFYSADAVEPPHVHVEREDFGAKFWLSPVHLDSSRGFSRAEIRRIERLVSAHADSLRKAWHEYFGN